MSAPLIQLKRALDDTVEQWDAASDNAKRLQIIRIVDKAKEVWPPEAIPADFSDMDVETQRCYLEELYAEFIKTEKNISLKMANMVTRVDYNALKVTSHSRIDKTGLA